MSKSGNYKKGRLRLEEIEFIKEHALDMNLEDIAFKLNRDPASCRQYYKGKIGEHDTRTILAKGLENIKETPEYTELKKQLTSEELKYFGYTFGKYVGQFKNDIMPSEEAQLFHLIKLEILMNRNMASRQEVLQDILRIESQLAALYVGYEDNKSAMSDTDKDLAKSLETQLGSYRQSESYRTKEYVLLEGNHITLTEKLKASREQRILKVENQASNIITLIKQFQDENFREREGRQMAMMKMASDKEKERLAAPHTYVDGSVDQPLLTPDTVGTMDEDKENV